LATAIAAAYSRVGIIDDPTTWMRPAPLLADVVAGLETATDEAGRSLGIRLRPWTHGSFKGLFDGPTTTTPAGRLTVWSVRHLPDELRAAGIVLALDAIWRDVDTGHDLDASNDDDIDSSDQDHDHVAAVVGAGPLPPITPVQPTARPSVRQPVRRLVVVDEAWTLLRDEVGARFLYRLAKAATQVLMRQAPQAIDAITAAFGLTTDEARMLLTAPRGHGLLLGASHRVGFRAVASTREHTWCRGPGEPDDAHEHSDSSGAGTATA
jgi:hypothetical protein